MSSVTVTYKYGVGDRDLLGANKSHSGRGSPGLARGGGNEDLKGAFSLPAFAPPSLPSRSPKLSHLPRTFILSFGF